MTLATVDRTAVRGALQLTGRQLQALRVIAADRNRRDAAVRLGVATLAEALAVAGRLGLLPGRPS